MPRARLYRPVTDEMGNLVADIQVRLIDPATNQNLAVPIYKGALDNTPVASQPIHFPDGIISLYLDAPRRVRIGVKKGIDAERFYEDIDILVTSLEGIAASAVSFTPGGTLVADDVQEAIVEVNTRLSGGLQAHLDDTLDAHDASAISFIPANNIDALNVQDALAEVGASIIGLEALTRDHTATDLALDARIDVLEAAHPHPAPVLTAPDGSTWRIIVRNDGTLATENVTPAPSPVPISDDFTSASAVPLHGRITPVGNATWLSHYAPGTTTGQDGVVQGGRLTGRPFDDAGGNYPETFGVVDTTLTDHLVRAVLAVGTETRQPHIRVRVSPWGTATQSNWIQLFKQNADVSLWVIVNGAIFANASYAGAWTDGATYELRAVGDQVRGYKNGVALGPAIAAGGLTGTKVGVRIHGDPAQTFADDFLADRATSLA